jgi:hypothetical protein
MGEPKDANFEAELTTARMMIEGPGRRALIVGVMCEDAGVGVLGRSVSHPAKRGDALVFAMALRREADRLEAAALGPSAP